MTIDILIESGAKRVFASAIDWPGWARSAKDEAGALSTLLNYGPRYGSVLARRSDFGFAAPSDAGELHVVQRQGGDSGTDFGVLSREIDADQRSVDDVELARQIAFLDVCRSAFDDAAARAIGATLTVGPRGGGRSLDKIVRHVVEADQAYLQQLGSKPPRWTDEPADGYGATIRELQVQALTARVRGESPPSENAVRKRWSPRYFVRRAAWHLLDHAWEIEDRSS
jgi:hypothetical protein